MNKFLNLLAFVFLYTIIFLYFPQATYASTLFQDNFDSGIANQWTPLLTYGPDLWQVKQVNGSYRYGAFVPNGSTILYSRAGNITTPNYTIEYDYLALQGEDKNFDFRWAGDKLFYEVHFTNYGALFVGSGSSIGTAFAPYVLQNGTQYHIKIVLQGQHIQFYVNTDKVFDLTDTNYQFSGSEQIGLVIGTGATFPTEAYFDNIIVTDNSANSDINVPLLKQTSDPWQSQEYDSAHLWSPSNITINRWGCALTSAAMILKYYGFNKLPDGTPLDPGSLNTWLKGYKDGYVRPGLVNWLKISELSRLAKNINGITGFDELEFKKIYHQDLSALNADLNNSIPVILEVPKHFIVAKGINGNTYDINDPYFDRQTLNDGYSNSFLTMGSFVPANSDLSYIMLIANANVSFEVLDSNGNKVGDSFIQNPLVDPVTNKTSGDPIKMFYLPKPDTGNYTIRATSSAGISKLSTYLYDKSGEVSMFDNQIIGSTALNINLDKNNSQNDKSKKIVTFDSVIADINMLDKGRNIDHKIAKKLMEYIREAEEEFNDGEERRESLKEIKQAEKYLNGQHKKIKNEDVYQLLLEDLAGLKELINNSKGL